MMIWISRSDFTLLEKNRISFFNCSWLGRLEPAYVRNSIYHMSHVFDSDGHVPWDTSVTKFNLMDSMVTVFLYNLICTNIAAVNEVSLNTDLSLYPNPAKEQKRNKTQDFFHISSKLIVRNPLAATLPAFAQSALQKL